MGDWDIIERELRDVRERCEEEIPEARVVTCVRELIRVELKETDYKAVSICLTFPENFPTRTLLMELKSKYISEKLLRGLIQVTEDESKKHPEFGAMKFIHFVRKFFFENPLSCCSEEISRVKSRLNRDLDKLKLIQKSSYISLNLKTERGYYYKVRIIVPHEYPRHQIRLEGIDTNFPRVFKAWFTEQSHELARRCVTPPLMKKQAQFSLPHVPKPSLEPVVSFLIDNVKRYAEEICGFCRKKCLPSDLERVIHDESAAAHVERVYCSHCYHHDCLILYLKSPPFKGVKKCTQCTQAIYHEKWKVTPELAEARWAHQQARERELNEVVDFFRD